MHCDFFWPPVPVPRFFLPLLAGLLLPMAARAADTEPFQVEVNILSAPVKAGETSIATVPRGTQLVAHEFNGDYYLVDLPGANPPRQGWIAKDDVHRAVDDFAVVRQRIAALPADQQAEAQQQAIAAAKEQDVLEVKLNQLMREGKADDAIQAAQQQALATKNLLGENNRYYANDMNNVGLAEERVARFAAAREDLAVALSIYRGLYGPKHARVATELNNLGDVAFHAGDYPTASKYHEQALAIRLAVFGEKDAAVALSFQNLGILATQAGDYAKARALFEKTLAINREALGKKSPTTAISLDNLGMVAAETGDFAGAIDDYQKALEIQYEAFGGVNADTIATYCDIGKMASRIDNYPLATKYFTLALSAERQLGGDKNPLVAHLLNCLGLVATEAGNFQGARKYFEQALAIRRDVLGDAHPDTADTRISLGNLAAALGDFKAALQYYGQALKVYRKSYGDFHPRVASTRFSIADAEAASGDWAAATQSMQDAQRILRRYVAQTLSGLSQKDQLTFLALKRDRGFYRALALAAARRDDPRLAVASAGWLLNGKAVAEEALSQRIRLLRDASNSAAAQLAGQLLSIRSRLATLTLQAPAEAHRAEREAELTALNAQEADLSRQLAAMGADVRQADPWVSVDDLRRNLPDDSMLVDIALLPLRNFAAHGKDVWQPPHYVAWLVPPTGIGEIQIVDLGAAAGIETAVRNARAAIQSARGNGGLKGLDLGPDAHDENAAGWQASLKALAALVWQPLEPRLKNFHEVILSPDAALWLVPWGALPTDDGRHFALERWQIRYVTSARDLVPARANAAATNAGAVVFADPDYNLAPQAAQANTAAILRGLQQSPSASTPVAGVAKIGDLAETSANVRSSGPLGFAPRLPGTAIEAAAIRPALAKYAGTEPQMYLGSQALEGVVKKLKRPRVLVLSTHGFFFSDQQAKTGNSGISDNDQSSAALDASGKPIENPLLRCGLLLAGANHRDELAAAGADDGVLTGLEIVGCDLRGTELVVLSACDTGLGDVENGEGVAGLRQAFQLAGARAVVASLWQVPDAATSQLMSDFFANLSAGQSKADALRNAQLKAIRGRREQSGAAPPLFWAAFTLTGQ